MDVFLTNHAVAEFKRHTKAGGSLADLIKNISSFFRVSPHLISAKTYTVGRTGKQPRLKGSATYLARGSWRHSKVFLNLVSDNGVFTAVTTLSGREFKRGVKKKRLIDLSEKPVGEEINYKMVKKNGG